MAVLAISKASGVSSGMIQESAMRKAVLEDIINPCTELPFLWWKRLTVEGRRQAAMVEVLYG